MLARLAVAYRLFKIIAGGEPRRPRRRDRHLLAGLRVHTAALATLAHLERAKARQDDLLTVGKTLGYNVDRRLDHLPSSLLTDVSLFSDASDEVGLLHTSL